jgi:hypothetical protein
MPRVAFDEAAAAARVHAAIRAKIGGRSTIRDVMIDLRASGQDITLTDTVSLLRKQADLETDDGGAVLAKG